MEWRTSLKSLVNSASKRREAQERGTNGPSNACVWKYSTVGGFVQMAERSVRKTGWFWMPGKKSRVGRILPKWETRGPRSQPDGDCPNHGEIWRTFRQKNIRKLSILKWIIFSMNICVSDLYVCLSVVLRTFHNLSLSSGSSKSPRLGSQDLAEDRTLALWTSKFGLKNLLNSSTVPSTFRDLRSQRDAVSHLKGSHLHTLHNGHPGTSMHRMYKTEFHAIILSTWHLIMNPNIQAHSNFRESKPLIFSTSHNLARLANTMAKQLIQLIAFYFFLVISKSNIWATRVCACSVPSFLILWCRVWTCMDLLLLEKSRRI